MTEDSIKDLVMSEDQWHTFMRPFVDAMCTLYPNKADHIEASAHEYSGPTLEELDVYGERVDTGLRVNDQPVWRYLRNDVHVCEVEPRGHIMFRWVEFDPD